jgi:hypothetical protein
MSFAGNPDILGLSEPKLFDPFLYVDEYGPSNMSALQ